MSIQPVNTAATSVPPPRQAPPTGASATNGAVTLHETPTSKVPGTTAQTDQPAQDIQVNRQQLDLAVKNVSTFVKTANSSLEFSIDKETGIDLVKVIDSDTQKVIRQIPSEEIVAIAKALDSLKGLLIQQKA